MILLENTEKKKDLLHFVIATMPHGESHLTNEKGKVRCRVISVAGPS